MILAGQFSLFGVLVYRLFNLQIVRHKEYFDSAESNQSRTIIDPVPRGLILDTNGVSLAENSCDYLVILDSRTIDSIDSFFEKIKRFLQISRN